MIQSEHYTPEHEIFRRSFRSFLEREIMPFREQWQAEGKTPRSLWRKAGTAGFLCTRTDAAFGGGGGDLYHCLIILEEQTRAGFNELTFYLHSDIIAPYIELYGTQDQKDRFLPRMAAGELVAAIAMTEPGAGSDLQAIRTSAIRRGNEYLINGQKTFISNGQVGNLICVAARTDADTRSAGISLLLVETDEVEGFTRGRNLEKLGCKAQDSSELFFDNVRVPADNLLGGEEGRGFAQLMQRLPEERLIMAMSAVANMEAAVAETIAYTREREAFGKRIIDFQNTRFKLAEAKTIATIARAVLEDSIDAFIEGTFDAVQGAMMKLWTTERQQEVVDECLQLFGGYGYTMEFDIARRYADARLGRIAGGTSEIMKEVIGRSLAGREAQQAMSAPNYTDEHRIFRQNARRYFEEECVPFKKQWERDGIVARNAWRRAADYGLLCMTVDAAYGGAGADLLFPVILLEEQVRSDAPAINLSLHNDVVAPYLEKYGTAEQKSYYLPKMASGELIGAIAMTEPGAGSDLLAMQTLAVRSGDNYVINGQKTFITNGHTADLVVLAARTLRGKGAEGISLFLVETANLPGFDRGRNIAKLGQHASDTAELFFSDVSLPAANLLGGTEGQGFYQLMDRLIHERLMAGVAAVAVIEHALETTVAYVEARKAFGRRVLDFQNTRFQLADCATTAMVARRFLNHCLALFRDNRLDAETAAMLKWWVTDQQCKVVDACLQLHGGYGYMKEYPIAHLWADSRVAKIYGGSNEIMKEIIGRAL